MEYNSISVYIPILLVKIDVKNVFKLGKGYALSHCDPVLSNEEQCLKRKIEQKFFSEAVQLAYELT